MAVWELAYVAKKNNYIVQGGTGFVTCVWVLEVLEATYLQGFKN